VTVLDSYEKMVIFQEDSGCQTTESKGTAISIPCVFQQDSDRRTTFVTAKTLDARHPGPLPVEEGATGRSATLVRDPNHILLARKKSGLNSSSIRPLEVNV
jgi:hypothetical protein